MFSGVSQANRSYWFNMINLYESIANQDALQGIWSFLADEEGLIFKAPKENVMSQENAVNLIKEAHMLRSKGDIAEGLQILEQALKEHKDEFEPQVRTELENKRRESQAELLKWEDIAKEMTSDAEYNLK